MFVLVAEGSLYGTIYRCCVGQVYFKNIASFIDGRHYDVLKTLKQLK
jgi:hypothetical protein